MRHRAGQTDVRADRVRTAHADAWEVEGTARVSQGGGAARVRGARLMASGLPFPKWNNADVTADDLDVEAIERWYAARDVPWGLRVPVELSVDIGTPLFVKRCFGAEATGFAAPDPSKGFVARRADGGEIERFAAAEAGALGDPIAIARDWLSPVFGRPGFEHWIAERGGGIAAVATAVWSNGDAGPAVMLTGLASVGRADGEPIAALAGAVLERAFGADPNALAHWYAWPDEDVSACLGLGFTEVPGLLVRVVRFS